MALRIAVLPEMGLGREMLMWLWVGQEVAKRASQLDTVLKGLKNKYNAAIVSSKLIS